MAAGRDGGHGAGRRARLANARLARAGLAPARLAAIRRHAAGARLEHAALALDRPA
jgi:hypothetical protein